MVQEILFNIDKMAAPAGAAVLAARRGMHWRKNLIMDM